MNILQKDNLNLMILATGQGLMMTANSLLVATSALVGYALAPDKSLSTIPLGLVFLAAMLTTIPASFLMKKIGRRNGFLLGVMFGIMGAMLSSWAILKMNFILFCCGISLLGVANGFGGYYRFAAADAVTKDRRSTAISLVLAGGVVAAFIGPNLANFTKDLIGSIAFAGSYISLVIVYITAMLFLLFLDIKQVKENEVDAPVRTLKEIISQPTYLVAVLGALTGFIVMSVIMTATPLAMRAGHFNFTDTVFVIQWHIFAMYAPSFFTGRLIKKFGVLNIMFVGAVIMVGCVTINTSGETLAHYWSGLFLLGLGWNFLFIGGTTLLTETYTESEKAKAQAFNDFAIFSSVSIAALSAGAILNKFGWHTVNYSALPILSFVILAILWLKSMRSREVAVTES